VKNIPTKSVKIWSSFFQSQSIMSAIFIWNTL